MFAIWLVSLFSIVMSVVFFLSSFTLITMRADPGGPALLPQILCVFTATAALIQLVLVIRTRNGIPELQKSLSAFFAQARLGIRPEEAEGPRVFMVMLVSVIYPVLITQFGFILSTAALVGFLCWVCQLKPVRTLVLVLIIPSLIYWLFNDILNARVPRGEIIDILMLF